MDLRFHRSGSIAPRFVKERRKTCCGLSCTDQGRESKTVPYDKITDCDVQVMTGEVDVLGHRGGQLSSAKITVAALLLSCCKPPVTRGETLWLLGGNAHVATLARKKGAS